MAEPQVGLDTLRMEDSDDDFQYEEVEVMDVEEDDASEDLDAALRSLQAFTSKQAPAVSRPRTPEVVPGQVTRKPEVIDDFLRNFFVKMGLTRTCESFEAEWYELKATGRLEGSSHVPDVYLRNAELEEEVASIRRELNEAKSIASKASATWDTFRKERDFHRMHHKRVAQEKNKLINDIKRLKEHFAKYEPTILELKKKYESAMKEKMLVSIERDKLATKNELIPSHAGTLDVNGDRSSSRLSATDNKALSSSQVMSPSAQQSFASPAATTTTIPAGTATKTATKKPAQPGLKNPSLHAPSRKNPFEDVELPPVNAKMMSLSKTFQGHLLSVANLAMHPTRQILVTASDDKTWKMWHIPDGDLIMCGEGHKDWVAGVDFHPAGTCLASGSGDSTVKIWDFEKQRCAVTFTDHKQAVWSVKFHHLGDVVASASLDHTVRLWDIPTAKCHLTLRSHVDSVNDVCWMPYTSNLCTASSDKTVSIWDARTGLCTQTFYGHQNSCNAATFNLRGTVVASTDADGVVKLWDARMVAEILTISSGKHPANKCAFDRSGSVLAVASDDGKVKCFSTVTGELLCDLGGHEDAVQSVIFDLEGRMVSCGSDNTFRVWT